MEVAGEEKYVVMFGGLHLEMALWNTLGDLLDASSWTTALVEAEVASPGVAIHGPGISVQHNLLGFRE